MKRFLQKLPLLLAVLLLLTTAVFADAGPKPQLTVIVEHAPSEPYYLDLLDEGDYQYNFLYDAEDKDLDPNLLAAFRAEIPDGWHACIAEGTNGAPIFGALTGEAVGDTMYHRFSYYGVPDTYRILAVTASGEVFLSDVLTHRTLQSTVTVDWATKTVTQPAPASAYALQFAATFVPTILIELIVLLLFGFKLKPNWLPFVLVNLVTQGLLHGYFAFFAVRYGVNFLYFLLLIPAELAVALIEAFIYRRTLKGQPKERAFVYGICANVCSAVLGYFLAEPVWRFVTQLS